VSARARSRATLACWRSGLLLAALVFLAACGSRERPNVLLIVADTLRADRLGVYGNQAKLTPFLDELAARGVVFPHAYAASSWTNPSVASLMTSRHQSQHQVLSFVSVLGLNEITLAEVLRANGWATAGFSANGGLAQNMGFAQGFEHYEAYKTRELPDVRKMFWPTEPAATLNRNALAWLDGDAQGRPAFLYLQYMEPHTPYAPPPDALDHVMQGAPHPDLEDVNLVASIAHVRDTDPDKLVAIQQAYDATVFQLDRELRALFQALDERGFFEHAIVVVTADHGEEFRDHGGMGHGKTLYNEVVHVPLLMLTPGNTSARVVETVTPLVDVAPTVLDLAGVRPPKTFAGQSVCSLLGPGVRCGQAPVRADGSALSELNSNANIDRPVPGPHRHALIVGDDKVLTGFEPDQVQFYDLQADPGEQNPAAFDPPTQQALRRRLEAMIGEASQDATAPSTRPVDDETRDRLRALGYTD